MRGKILAVQFRKDVDASIAEQISLCREIGECADVDFISAVTSVINWESPAEILANYDGVIFGGSGDYDFDGNRIASDVARTDSYVFLNRLRPLLTYIFENDVPTLGICYGHQLLGVFAGAKAQYDTTQKKSRSHTVKLHVCAQEHPLFSGLPETFSAHYMHKDALDRVPEGAKLLVSGGDECRFSALQYKKNIFTTQFHPEINLGDVRGRMLKYPDYFPAETTPEDLFRDEPHSNVVLQNFAKLVTMMAETVVSKV